MMFWGKRTEATRTRGFLTSLSRDIRGNALMIMAAVLIPVVGMVGGGIDASRMYILKTRLQHACDAGSLAGRKAMGGGTWAFNSYYPRTQANLFFDGNFQSGAFGSSDLSRTFTENAGKVTGTVSATIPMTLMRVFGKTTETIEVTCSSEMRLPNTDVMFVLDTTGSMASQQPGDSVSKMDALKTSVKCFYEIVARLDTDANCTTGTPSGGTGDQVQIRFGFMPYSTNVNVGKLLPTSYFADSWNYQTRKATYTTQTVTNNGAATVTGTSYLNASYGGWSNDTILYNSTQAACDATLVPPDSAFTPTGGESGQQNYNAGSGNPRTATWTTDQAGYYYEYRTSFNNNNDRCRIQVRRVDATLRRNYSQTTSTTTAQVFSGWNYDRLPVNVGLLKNGTSWRTSFDWPIGSGGANRTISWDGCIEERKTVQAVTNFDPIPSGAVDLDMDLVPTSGTPDSLWGPALPSLIYARAVTTDWNQLSLPASNSTSDYYNNVPYYCPTEARKLQEWSASAFDSYVDSLVPTGNTYHDIGLIWGARFASPTGIFASENAATAKGGEIERHIIFMTDGDACTGNTDYAAYGFPWLDRRTTSSGNAPTGGCTSNSYSLTEQVNKRTEGLCAAIKNKTFEGRQAFTLWVIAFGDLASETETRLQNCATSGRYFKATSASALQTTFKSIADQISMLRLTK